MPADVRDKAFDPFFTTKHRGTGLGLPIAKRIIDAHGGEIQIETPPGGGTIVSIDLPATR
jgi:signal transduction histidine kinase